jgi:hypothetical protein
MRHLPVVVETFYRKEFPASPLPATASQPPADSNRLKPGRNMKKTLRSC